MKGTEKGVVANIAETFRGGPGRHFCSKINNYILENEKLEKDIETEFFLKNSFTSLLSKVPNLKRNFYAQFFSLKKKEVKKRLFHNFESIIDQLSDEDIIRIHKRLRIENEEEEEEEEEDETEEEEDEEKEKEKKKEEYKDDQDEKREKETNEKENLLGSLHEWGNGTKGRVRTTKHRRNTFSLVSTVPENINLEKLVWLHINTNDYSWKRFVNFNKRINDIWDFYTNRSPIMNKFGKFSKWNNFILRKMLKRSALVAEYGNKRRRSKYMFQRHKHIYCPDVGGDMLGLLRKCHFKCNMLTKRSKYRNCRDYIKESLNFEIKINAPNFIKINQVGQGAYGDVWLAEDVSNARRMALKKLKLRDIRQGFAKTYIREISLLNTLKHPNIVELLGVVCALGPNLRMEISTLRLNMQIRKRKGIDRNFFLGESRNIELEKRDAPNNTHTLEKGNKEKEIERSKVENNIVDSSTTSVFSKPPGFSKDESFSSGKTYIPFIQLNKQNRLGYTLWMVFEYIPFDMSGYLEALRQERNSCEKLKYTNLFTISEIKDIMLQLLTAVAYCHEKSIMHRDIKTSNLLIDAEGTLKLADFGLARFYSAGKDSKLVNRVITLWYRPPELLLGESIYDDSVDIWSCGCVFGELLTSAPLFSGEDELEVLKMIASKTRMPPKNHLLILEKWSMWNDLKKNPLHPTNYNTLSNEERQKDFENKLLRIPGVTPLGLDLLKQMLRWNPMNRISAKKALQHPWFYSEPLPHTITKKENIKAAHSFMTKNYKKIEMIQTSSNLKRQQENFRCMNVGSFRKRIFRNSFDFNKIMLKQKMKSVKEYFI